MNVEEAVKYYREHLENRRCDPRRARGKNYAEREFQVMYSMQLEGRDWADIYRALGRTLPGDRKGPESYGRWMRKKGLQYSCALRKFTSRRTAPYTEDEFARMYEMRQCGLKWSKVMETINNKPYLNGKMPPAYPDWLSRNGKECDPGKGVITAMSHKETMR